MTKNQIFGIILFIIGVSTQLSIKNTVAGFFSAILIGLGIGLAIAGKIKK